MVSTYVLVAIIVTAFVLLAIISCIIIRCICCRKKRSFNQYDSTQVSRSNNEIRNFSIPNHELVNETTTTPSVHNITEPIIQDVNFERTYLSDRSNIATNSQLNSNNVSTNPCKHTSTITARHSPNIHRNRSQNSKIVARRNVGRSTTLASENRGITKKKYCGFNFVF